ncbi:MAG: hypothetical protein M3Q33_02665 [Acidobacteriota bacterium]|nr:hypothetical protein [Acidobacteriota bacterium]
MKFFCADKRHYVRMFAAKRPKPDFSRDSFTMNLVLCGNITANQSLSVSTNQTSPNLSFSISVYSPICLF